MDKSEGSHSNSWNQIVYYQWTFVEAIEVNFLQK
jgi:hypothetical protein